MKKLFKRKFPVILYLVILLALTNVAFSQEIQESISIKSTIAFTINEKDLFPEGIAYDSKTKQFFLSSINKEKIVAIDQAGNQSDFLQSGQDGMLRSLGLKVDEQRRRLWVVSNSDWDNSVVSAVHVYNIDTKKLIKSFFTTESNIPVFNDLILTNSGAAYISDYAGNSIYAVPFDLSKVELFLKSDSLLAGANGLAISPDNSLLYVASYRDGIVLVDLKSKVIKPISKQVAAQSSGIDGLMFYKNSLIAILNGESDMSKHNIARYQLNTDGHEIVSASIIDQNNPLFNEPTTGVMVGDELYCLAATHLRIFAIGKIYDMNQLKNPLILKYNLEKNKNIYLKEE